MKLKFDPKLEYQKEAIEAVVNVFEGQPLAQSNFEINAMDQAGLSLTEHGIGNKITLNDEQLLTNVHKVQETNNIEKTGALQGRDFSVEMETGTGKTYVYLRTIFELSQKYGFKKFIIVVPSIAVREGVLKSIDITKGHFRTLYNNEPFESFIYDSEKLGRVRQFATSNKIQIMVINIQSFQRDITDQNISEMTADELKKLNVINRESDKMSGHKPIEFIQSTNPIVIIDEPQSVDNTSKAKHAIENLNPVCILRYSATHRSFYNLLYKLDPIRAYDLRLVKRIEVSSVYSNDGFNDAYVKLLKTDNKNSIKAYIQIHKVVSGTVKSTKLWVKQGNDLYTKSGERENYHNGYIVQNIDCTPGSEYIEFSNGKFLRLGEEIGGLNDDIMKAQVKDTIEQHLKKERLFKPKGIKVLSLFFIDKVANYRTSNENSHTGKIKQWFEEAYEELTAKPRYKQFAAQNISKIHGGYFSQDKHGHAKDTNGKTNDDKDTYNLIMRDKERLLDPNGPLRFIFSHSALREGWDSPNVFQICTLNESYSQEKKRQEIGRGLRLPVNKNGDRIHDVGVNRLTIIANESYEDFARSLQTEFEEDCGTKFGRIEKTAFAKIVRNKGGTNEEIGQEESAKIWQELNAACYINDEGYILDKFTPDDPDFEMNLLGDYDDINANVIDIMKSFIFKNRVPEARDRASLKLKKEVYLSDDFQALWEKIKHRTRYRVSFSTDDVIACAIKRIKASPEIKPIHISITRVKVDITNAGVSADTKLETKTNAVENARVLPDLLAFLQKETELTRSTLVEILKRSNRLSEFGINPQAFMALTAREISQALHDLMLEGIQYEKIANHSWEMSRIGDEAEEGITSYLNNLYKVKKENKCLFDNVPCDSEIEKKFAKDLDDNEHVRLFVKLPGWFKIDTPIGTYNPDWAFVTERDEKLYFVRETKSTVVREKQRPGESYKTQCGKKHFEALGVDYAVVTNLDEVTF